MSATAPGPNGPMPPADQPGRTSQRSDDEAVREAAITQMAYARWLKAGKPVQGCDEVWSEVVQAWEDSPDYYRG